MRHASALVFIFPLSAARTIIFRLITKGFVCFASVALIAAVVQVTLISLPSAQTISAQTAREAPGSSPTFLRHGPRYQTSRRGSDAR
jgi:hypothetical protein